MSRFSWAAVVFVAVVTGWTLATLVNGQQQTPSHLPNVSRYQLVINPQVRADTFLLDTESGHIWKPVQYAELVGDPVVWEMQDRVNSEEELASWLKTHALKRK